MDAKSLPELVRQALAAERKSSTSHLQRPGPADAIPKIFNEL
jgi:hypothetical protein